ncbi:abortive infection protein [Halorubrum persicum]|uniref:Abortive infection protein n=1 Tax=Halorubrum persicum TaxID=1383844 RepID=A0A2G1WIA0_9EURY|nr:abortive infection protein [Halorubrum persicum]PHQ38707.1 abortive infection protein [Halorubrum persicum]
MTSAPTVGRRGNVPYWTTVAVAALYLPASIIARALVDPAYAAGRRGVPPAVVDAAGTLPATLGGGALWIAVAGAFLYAFAAELDAMRTRTAWSPPDKGYLILAAGSLLAHPLTGVPLLFLLVPGYTLHRGLRVR